MKDNLSEKQKLLLFKALKNNGSITVTQANKLYSGNGGRDALMTLEAKGYLSDPQFGRFKVKKVPTEIKNEFKQAQES